MSELRRRIYRIIFHTTTTWGRIFDIVLLVMIVISVLLVVLESVQPIQAQFPDFFYKGEWFFTIIFTIEYLLRIYSHPKPIKYIFSFMGVVDLLAILPTYFGLFFDQITFLLTVRAFRLLRMFRIMKLTRYISEANQLMKAITQSLRKIVVFFEVVLVLVLFMGTIMYLVEGNQSGFTSIPQSIYWAIVTITTVGYGDIAPMTVTGKLIASIAMLTGYSIIAVPTGIITVEIGKLSKNKESKSTKYCTNCNHSTTDPEAHYCVKCGSELESFDESD